MNMQLRSRLLPAALAALVVLGLAPALRAGTEFSDSFDRKDLVPGAGGDVTWEARIGEWKTDNGKAVLAKREAKTAGLLLAHPADAEPVTAVEATLQVDPRGASDGRPWVGLIVDFDPVTSTGYCARFSHREEGTFFQVVKTSFTSDGSSEGDSLASKKNIELDPAETYLLTLSTETPGTLSFTFREVKSGRTLAEGKAKDKSPRESLSGIAGIFSSQQQTGFDDFTLKTE